MKNFLHFLQGKLLEIKKFSSIFIVNFFIFASIQIAYTGFQLTYDIKKQYTSNEQKAALEKIIDYRNFDRNILFNSLWFFTIISFVFIGNTFYFLYLIRKIRKKDLLLFIQEKSNISRIVTLMMSENLHHQMKTPLASISSEILFIQELLDLKNNPHSCSKCPVVVDSSLALKSVESALNNLKMLHDVVEAVKLSNSVKYSDKNKTIGEILVDAINIIKSSEARLHLFNVEITEELNKYALVNMTNENFLDVIISHLKNSIEAGASRILITSSNELLNGIIKIYIIDNGSGIDKKKIPFIYDLDFSIEKSEMKKISGTKLFLAREIVRQFPGCDDRLKNTSSRGTTFEITVPARLIEEKDF
jgi:signal transduction histidine kinase